MFKTFMTTAVATAVIAAATLSVPTQAEARDGFGAGLATGLIGGAIVGGAIANSQNRYNGPEYESGAPVYDNGYAVCHRVRFRDDYGNVYFRRVCN